jgi:hypothetical protein
MIGMERSMCADFDWFVENSSGRCSALRRQLVLEGHDPAIEKSDHPGRIRDSWRDVCVIEWIVEIIERVTTRVIGIGHVTYVNPSLRRTPLRFRYDFSIGRTPCQPHRIS